jgi:polyhydroxybutyrate depolymerase
MRLAIFLAALMLAAAPAAARADDCGTPEGECATSTGVYRLLLPATREAGPFPAVVYLHGYNGSPAGVIKNAAMLATALARGYAMIVPQGQPTSTDRPQLNWSVRDGRALARDDLAFLA